MSLYASKPSTQPANKPSGDATSQATQHTLDIGGMSGDTCVSKVQTALRSVPNVTMQSVKVGSAVISANQAGCDAACSAVTRAGYKASEDTSIALSSAQNDSPAVSGKHAELHSSQKPTGTPEAQPSDQTKYSQTKNDAGKNKNEQGARSTATDGGTLGAQVSDDRESDANVDAPNMNPERSRMTPPSTPVAPTM